MTCHVCAQTTPVVAALHEFHVWSYPQHSYIFQVSSKPFRGFGEQAVEICPFPLLWLLVFTTACTTKQTVTINMHFCHIRKQDTLPYNQTSLYFQAWDLFQATYEHHSNHYTYYHNISHTIRTFVQNAAQLYAVI